MNPPETRVDVDEAVQAAVAEVAARAERVFARAALAPVPRVAVRVGEAAAALGVSADFFAEHVAGELRWVRRGAIKLVAVSELERWVRDHGERVLEGFDR